MAQYDLASDEVEPLMVLLRSLTGETVPEAWRARFDARKHAKNPGIPSPGVEMPAFWPNLDSESPIPGPRVVAAREQIRLFQRLIFNPTDVVGPQETPQRARGGSSLTPVPLPAHARAALCQRDGPRRRACAGLPRGSWRGRGGETWLEPLLVPGRDGALLVAASGVAHAGELSGVVRIDDRARTSIAPARIKVERNPEVCGAEIVDEPILARDGGVANAVVWLEGSPSTVLGPNTMPKPTTIRLRIERCRFRPRVLAAGVGSTLMLTNADAAFHNVHAHLGELSLFNIGLPVPGEVVRVTLDGRLESRPSESRRGDTTFWCSTAMPATGG